MNRDAHHIYCIARNGRLKEGHQYRNCVSVGRPLTDSSSDGFDEGQHRNSDEKDSHVHIDFLRATVCRKGARSTGTTM